MTPPHRRVLVVAYYFPPMALSGVQRVAKFVKYLPAAGWEPVVLTVDPAGYFAYDASLLEEVEAAGVTVHRTPSWDPTRLFGRRTVAMPREAARRSLSNLSQFFFLPDNKIGWYPHAVRFGRRLLRRERFDLVFSSAPPYTAHLIGAALAKGEGLPFVADYRDDWLGNPRHVYPTGLHRRLHRRLEGRVQRLASRALTINEPIRRSLAERHPDGASVHVLPQGFDPADFEGVPDGRSGRHMRLLYSGIFYDAQSPDAFLRALAALIEERPAAADRVEAVFVGLVPEASRQLAASLGLEGVVRYTGYLPHADVAGKLLSADVLWMTVGRRTGAETISTGKLFEYIGAGRPILALVPEGAAREALAGHGATFIAPPDDEAAIARQLSALVDLWERGRLPEPDERFVASFDRRRLAAALAAHFEACLEPPGRLANEAKI